MIEEIKNNKNKYTDKKEYSKFIIETFIKNKNILLKLTNKFKNNENNNELISEFNEYKKYFYYALKKFSKYKLYGKDEINLDQAKNIKYYTIICNDKLKLESFKIFIIFYYIESLIQKELYIPIDYEFNTKKIALMQINFEGVLFSKTIKSFIYILYPPDLDKDSNEFFIKNILCNNYIYKILHGSDSLDIPYTYTELLENNKDYIIEFTKKLVDTKYLCEYNHNDLNVKRKCKIKELLLEQKVITQKKYNDLEKNEEKMGKIYDIIIDINNLSDELTKYSLYDVIYLKFLFQKFIEIDDKIYRNLIPDMTRYIYLSRRGIINFTEKFDKIIYVLNLGKIEEFEDNLNNIFNNILELLFDKVIMNIFNIDYFKKYFINLLKAITYDILIQFYTIIMPNNTQFNGYINVSSIFIKLRELELFSIFNLLNKYKEDSIKYLA
tara:strand:- start:1095 stop:2411 length:1317 start_codon:yes stop_codon:yes gene_type:complete